MIFAHGSRFGGHSLFIKDRKLTYVYNFLGIRPEQKFVSKELPTGKHALGMEFIRDKAGARRIVAPAEGTRAAFGINRALTREDFASRALVRGCGLLTAECPTSCEPPPPRAW